MTRPLSVLLVDDVALARFRLRQLLAAMPQVRVDAEAASLAQARDQLQGRRFDLLLLDLVLPDGRGWELPQQQPWLAAHTIFVTALPQHALRAFELGVADYLLKPVAAPRLQEAIERVRPLAGLGVGIASAWAVAEALADGRLVQLAPLWSAPPLPISLVHPPGRLQPARLRAFIQLMRDFLPGVPGVRSPVEP